MSDSAASSQNTARFIPFEVSDLRRTIWNVTDIAPLAAVARARFGDPGVHAFVRSGRTVHAVSLGEWIDDEQVPELLCHTGVAGFSPAALEPTRFEVTCARCLRRIGGSGGRQLVLFDSPARRGGAVRGGGTARQDPSMY